jgi:hypothetical protein
MAAQQGFEYEKNAAQLLKEYKLVPKDFVPAGSGHDQPDLVMIYNGVKAGVELKITMASAGSLVLKHEQGKWTFGVINKSDIEKQFIVDVAKSVNLYGRIAKAWKKTPYKRSPQDGLWKATAGKIPRKKQYERDRDAFPDIKVDVPATLIERYYNRKDTYYVNVGTHGFYLFGPKNPLKLSGLPRFSACASATLRTRVQYKGNDNYQFTTEMQFQIPVAKKSPYNIAPIKGSSVQIDKSLLNLSCFP